ncbi:MAG TPA: VWA domain-containing protein [Anaerolineales bacterium]|nr:VWA domain-containing protein [Anaerolineales bacterium]
MTFLWPGFLYLLALVPVTVGFYVWILHRRRPYAVRYSSLSLVRNALPPHSGIRRHLPFALFTVALAGLLIALARPVTVVAVPTAQATIILAIDVSRSMCSTDIAPTRLQAAESAATTFIRHQSAHTQIGIVAFAGFAELIQPPTTDADALQAAIESLLTGRRTGIGNAILKSLDSIAEVDKAVAPSVVDPSDEPPPVAKGAYAPDIIVVLTDGASNTGTSPLDAAQQAADRGVRVYTIGFGTPNGSETASCQTSDPSGIGGFGGFGGGFGGGGLFRRGIDELTLKNVASLTGGAYYPASSAAELQHVFQNLPTYLIIKHETSEVSAFFTAAAAILAVAAIALSLLWHPLL